MTHNARPPIADGQAVTGLRGQPDRARLLDLLGGDESEPLTTADLRERGVRMPGQAIYELELDGYPVERVYHHSQARRCKVLGYRLGGASMHPCGLKHDHARTRGTV
jgi:hypothetical protein